MSDINGYRRPATATQPEYLYPPYVSSRKRAPAQPLVMLPHTLTEITGPVFGASDVAPSDHDLNHQHAGESLGERIIVNGRVRDENTRPVPRTLIELWHANAAGRYRHSRDEHDAPWDPNFTGLAVRLATQKVAIGSLPSSPVLTPGAIITTPGGQRIFISPGSAQPS